MDFSNCSSFILSLKNFVQVLLIGGLLFMQTEVHLKINGISKSQSLFYRINPNGVCGGVIVPAFFQTAISQ